MGLTLLGGSGDLDASVRTYAFRLLLESGRPVAANELAGFTGLDQDQIERAVDRLDQAGRIRRNRAGLLVGACGLSVVPYRHHIEIEDRKFWTWCAYDILGIFGALNANGRGLSHSPSTGGPIEVLFSNGRPEPTSVVLFFPDDSFAASCTNIYEEWCPNSNLFEDETAAQQWRADRQIEGQVLTLARASELATKEWASLVMDTGGSPDAHN